MQEDQGPVHAPEFPPNVTWLQGGPLRMADLRGKPVLIDFWDYTCVNCLRTLPYVKEWHRRYGPLGLTVIGVHAPEFSFARDGGNVARAVREQGITYPVVLDNEYAIWQAYANRYWPAKYLIDGQGYLRGYHHGEGAYREIEEALQALLRESFPEILLPGVMDPVRDDDRVGAVCYRVTPELYLGYARGPLAPPPSSRTSRTRTATRASTWTARRTSRASGCSQPSTWRARRGRAVRAGWWCRTWRRT